MSNYSNVTYTDTYIVSVASLKAFFKMLLSYYIFISWQIKQL